MKKTALIVGANSDIAYEFAKILAKKKFNLILLSKNYQNLILKKKFLNNNFKVKTEIKKFDITDTYTFNKIFKKYSNVNLIFIACGLLDKSNKKKNIVSQINFIGPMNFIKKILKFKMKKLKDVMCITSVSGDRIDAELNEYSKAKKNLSIFLKDYQKYFLKKKIFLKDFKLGYIKTNMTKHILFRDLICASPSKLADYIYICLGKKNISIIYYPKIWINILKVYNIIKKINPFLRLSK
jgi:short-subunit dehydrogenase|tara:strand:- start:3620 stop:4336 length:717 start_codon:yes stop_codon:yes gene_type:complete